jgi:hypothetical protein
VEVEDDALDVARHLEHGAVQMRLIDRQEPDRTVVVDRQRDRGLGRKTNRCGPEENAEEDGEQQGDAQPLRRRGQPETRERARHRRRARAGRLGSLGRRLPRGRALLRSLLEDHLEPQDRVAELEFVAALERLRVPTDTEAHLLDTGGAAEVRDRRVVLLHLDPSVRTRHRRIADDDLVVAGAPDADRSRARREIDPRVAVRAAHG